MINVKLGDYVEVDSGYAFKSKLFNETEGIPLIRIRDVNAGVSKTYYSGEYSDNYIVYDGDLLITMDGEFNIREWNGGKALLNQRVCRIKSKTPMLNKRYLLYLLPKLLKDIEDKTPFVTVKHLSVNDILESLVYIPNIITQNKIVEVLDIATKIITNRKAQLKVFTDLIQSIYLEMFGDPIINNYGFKTEQLENICKDIKGGGTPSKSKPEYYKGDIPWVTPKDMKTLFIQDSIDHINEEAIENSSTKLIPPNSLLMVIRSGILKRYLPIAINKREVTLNQDMKAFIPDEKIITTEFLLLFFQNYQRKLLSQVRSVTADNLDFKQIRNIEVPVPPLEKQYEFRNTFNVINDLIRNLQNQVLLQEELYSSLSQRAFNGELFKG